MDPAQICHRQVGCRWHRHQWWRGVDGARCACAGYRSRRVVGRLRRLRRCHAPDRHRGTEAGCPRGNHCRHAGGDDAVTIRPVPSGGFETTVPILVVGGGAAGLCAALAAHEAGAEVAILERDPVPRGSTALSAGLIPAAATRFQKLHGIVDTPELFAGDIRKKAHGEADDAIVDLVTAQSAPTVEWLADRYDLPFSVVHDFDYPGHAARRMHGLPSRSGAELIDRLRQAVEEAGLPLIVQATVTGLFSDAERRIHGLEITRPDGTRDAIGCEALILACNGYGGNPTLVAARSE